MSIIDSIYESTGAFSINIKHTDNYLLMRGGEIDSIAYVQQVGEMYNENIDCRILTARVVHMQNVEEALIIKAILCFEYLDKHVFIKLSTLLRSKAGILSKSDYQFIPKELIKEIKGGIYKVDKELLDSIEV